MIMRGEIRHLFVVLACLGSGCALMMDDGASKRLSRNELIATPVTYYSTAKARSLGRKYKDNLDRLTERIVRNSNTSQLQFANNISSVGGIGFFTHSATKSADERYLEVVLATPETFESTGEYSEKVNQLFSRYGQDLLGILAGDTQMYQDKELAGYGLNLTWRNVISDTPGNPVSMARAIIYFSKEKVSAFLRRELGQPELLRDAVIFAVEEDGPLNLVSYKPHETKPDFRPAIREDNLATGAPASASSPPPARVGTAGESKAKSEPLITAAKKTASVGPESPASRAANKSMPAGEKTDRKAPPLKPQTSAELAPRPLQHLDVGVEKSLKPDSATEKLALAEGPTVGVQDHVDPELNRVLPQATPRLAADPGPAAAKGPMKDKFADTSPVIVSAPQKLPSDKPLEPSHGEIKATTGKATDPAKKTATESNPIQKKKNLPPVVAAARPLGAEPQPAETSNKAEIVAAPTRIAKLPTVAPGAEENATAPTPAIAKLDARTPAIEPAPAAVLPMAREIEKAAQSRESPVTSSTDSKTRETGKSRVGSIVTSSAKVITPQQSGLVQPDAKIIYEEEKLGVKDRAVAPLSTQVAETGVPMIVSKPVVKAATTEPAKSAEVKRPEGAAVRAWPEELPEPAMARESDTTAPNFATPPPVKAADAPVRPSAEKLPEPVVSREPGAEAPAHDVATIAAPRESQPEPMPAVAATVLEKAVVKPAPEQLALLKKPSEPLVETKPMVRPAPKPLEGFIIQVAFNDKEKAQSWAEKMAQRGYAVSVTKAGAEGALRVRLGNFAIRDDAERQLRNIKVEGISGIIVNLPQAFRPEARSSVP